MLLNFTDVLLLLLIFQLLFISVYLFTKSNGKAVSNRLLGSFFLAIALSLTDSFLLDTGLYTRCPEAGNWSGSFPLLYGPLLLLYTESLIYRHFALSPKKQAHFIPVVLLFIITSIVYELQPRPLKLQILKEISLHQIPAYLYGFSFLMFTHFCVYAALSLRLIRQYNNTAANKFSNVQQLSLRWLSSMIISFIALFIIAMLITHLKLPGSMYGTMER